jgi:hypothetical protein
MRSDNVVSMSRRSRAVRKYAIRAVMFQEGEWLCARCLEYDLVVQAKTLRQVSKALQLLLARSAIEDLCQRARIPAEDFGSNSLDVDFDDNAAAGVSRLSDGLAEPAAAGVSPQGH